MANSKIKSDLCAEHISKCKDGIYKGYWYKRIFELEDGKKYDTFPYGRRGDEFIAKQKGLQLFIVHKGRVFKQAR